MKDSRIEILQGLRRAMEFYTELGFEYLPVQEAEFTELLVQKVQSAKNEILHQHAEESVGSSHQDKEGALNHLREEIGDCRRCKLSKNRKNIVFGEGSPEARLMFIGEGPGRDEDIQARPFVGEAGKLLTRLIEKLGLRREDVYIANIIKCRPPYNRNPEEDEIASCRPFVEKQVEIISPKVIVCLGKVSANSLLGNSIPISRLRGKFYQYTDIPVMPTFHPAYLMRNPRDKWLTWDDMQKVMERLK